MCSATTACVKRELLRGILASVTVSYSRVPGFQSRQELLGYRTAVLLIKRFYSHSTYKLLVYKNYWRREEMLKY